MNHVEIAAIILAVWNVIVFFIYGIDKTKAKHGKRRISEKTLMLTAVLMGAPGALLGMTVFRHKTKHIKFKIGVPLLLIVNVAVIIVAVNGLGVFDMPAQYQKIPPEEAKAMMDDGSATVLDVRTTAEFEEAHIAGAVLLPDTDIRDMALELLPNKKQTILVYCRTGIRSERAARALVELGYSKVYDFGGIVDWPYETVGG